MNTRIAIEFTEENNLYFKFGTGARVKRKTNRPTDSHANKHKIRTFDKGKIAQQEDKQL